MVTDEALITAVAQGNAQAFNSLYERFRQKVFSTAYHYLQDQADAEELVQDVFVELYHSASRYNFKASVSTWIYRITTNKCIDKLRYRKAKKRIAFISHFFQPGKHQLAEQAEQAFHPPDEEIQQLYRFIDRLPEQQKTALILTQIQQLSIKETAEIMKSSPKAVESLTQRAKTNLRKFFKKE
jgi:RNA polymerase sigma-70 factor (ECF subfamily)